jgi:glyoxylase-like metal-dependent hydrolase (beta-lactamase superfamily II)
MATPVHILSRPEPGREDAEQIVRWTEATGKNLTTIYITHGHGEQSQGASS